jgi:hypothetical protein
VFPWQQPALRNPPQGSAPSTPSPSAPWEPPVAAASQIGGEFIAIDGGNWQQESDLCGEVGTLYDAHRHAYVEARTALELPFETPRGEATLDRATLSVYHVEGNGLDTIAIHGYAGDGAIDLSDAEVGGPSVDDVHRSARATPIYESHDVTSLIDPSTIAAGWAGFLLRQEPPTFEEEGSGHTFDCPDDHHFPRWFPVLTIKWLTDDGDQDGDGVSNAEDRCPGTAPDEFPALSEDGYRFDGTLLISDFPNNPPRTLMETGGCSASQVIEEQGNDREQIVSGLTLSSLEAWLAE